MKRGRALPLHVVGALAILRRWQAGQPDDLRARVDPWLGHLETMYRETRAEREAGDARAYGGRRGKTKPAR